MVVKRLMGKTLYILGILTFSLSACVRSVIEYSFLDIGLHIKVPTGYVVRDYFPKLSFRDTKGKAMSDSIQLQELEAGIMKGLIVISTPEGDNTVSFNLALQTSKTGNFEQYYSFSKSMQQLMARQQMHRYDTASSVLPVDDIVVYKYMTYAAKADSLQYSGFYLAQVKRYFLVIKFDFSDREFGQKIEKLVLDAKFD